MRNRVPWRSAGKYLSMEEAKTEDLYSNMWHVKDRRVLTEMAVERYYCKNRELEGCPAQKCIKLCSRDGFHYVELAFEHTPTCPPKTEKVVDVKKEILSIYKSGCLLPWQIRYEMDKDGIDVEIGKVYQTIYRYKRKLFNGRDITTTKVLEVCEEFNRARDEKDCSEKKGYIADLVLEREDVKILITTKNSLILLSEAENLSIDSTYKLINIGYPIVVVGMTDANQSFVLLAMCVVSDETMETYLWVLNVLRRECEKYGLMFNPTNVIGDLAPQITQALQQFEPGCFRRHCWFHVSKAMKDVMNGLPNLYLKDEINSDVHFLQLRSSWTIFKRGWALLLEKWQQINHAERCIAQLNQNYYLNNRNWYEGCAVHSPSTNNALERLNKTIKTHYTSWKRTNILEFIRLSVVAVEDYAFEKEKVPSIRRYNEDEICHDRYANDVSFKELGSIEGHVNYLFAGASKAERELSELLRRKLKDLSFTTFNEFRDLLTRAVIVSAKNDIQSLKDIFCSCEYFVKKKKCNHVYVFLTRSGKKELLNSELLFVKNKRGRPKNIRRNTSLVREVNSLIYIFKPFLQNLFMDVSWLNTYFWRFLEEMYL